jgi:hypothetical protein
MPIATRLTNAGTLLVNGSFDENTSIAPAAFRTTSNTVLAGTLDEFTGAPVVNTSLKLWLDVAQTTSYSGSGATWTDLSGNGNNGTLVNAPTFSSIVGGGTLIFNGTNQYVTSSFATTSGQAVTYCGWLYSTETTATYRNFVDSVLANPMIWWNTSGQIEFDAAMYTTTTVYRNQWVHVALSKPSGSSAASYYVNGVLVGTGSAYTTPTTTPTWLSRATAQTWQGSCAVIQAYNQALTAAEIAQNYNALRSRYEKTAITATQMPVVQRELSSGTLLVNSGGFDEFTGAPVVDTNLMVWVDAAQTASYPGSGATWTDLSSNAKNYTLSNSPTFSSTTGGGVITFAGASSQYATTATTLFNSTTTNTYSINIWVYPTGAGQIVQVNGQSTPNISYHYTAIEITAAGLIYLGQWTGTNTVIASSARNLNAWYNLVITYNGTTATAYINGTSVGSSAITWSAPGANTFFALMSQDSTNMSGTTAYASGNIGAFMVYNRALSADEVTTNFNALRGRYGI